jgi:splicing factor 3A subunit 1
VARNGQKFLTGLTERESKNPQFDFLKPTHLLFGYFTHLVDSYSRCLVPKKDELTKLQRYVEDPTTILELGTDRYEFEKEQMMVERKAKDEKAKEEEKEVDLIDWHDFVTVETIHFDDDDMKGTEKDVSLPAESTIKKQADDEEMEVETEESRKLAEVEKQMKAREEAKAKAMREVQKVVVATDNKDEDMEMEPEVKIKTNYVRNPAGDAKAGYQKCPKCGGFIANEEFEKHFQIEMVSPGFFAQRKDQVDKAEGRAIATGDEVVSNLEEFRRQRPDVYGTVDQQVSKEPKEERSKRK